MVDRVNALGDEAPRCRSFLARFGQRVDTRRAQPHIAAAAGELEPEDPGLRAGRHDLQVEAAAIGIEPRRF